MSPLTVLGTFGTLISTVVMLPHLVHAIRHRRPSGATCGWLVGALSGSTWGLYGVASGDLLVAAPNFVNVPANLILFGWSLRVALGARRAGLDVAHLEALYAAKAAHPAGRRAAFAASA